MNSVVGQRQHLERGELLEEWTDLTEAVLAEHQLAYLTQLVLARKVEDRLLGEIVARHRAKRWARRRGRPSFASAFMCNFLGISS